MTNIENLTGAVPGRTLVTTIKDTFRKLLKMWWMFLIVGVIAGVLGIVYASMQEPSYESKATFAIDDADGAGMGNLLNLASQFGLTVGAGKSVFAGDNILEILKSRRLIEDVLVSVDTFDGKAYTLIQYYLQQTPPEKRTGPDILFPAGIRREDLSRQQDSVLYSSYKHFNKNLIRADRPNKKLGIYEVKVTTPSEELSIKFAEHLLEAANILYTEIRTKKARQTVHLLEERASNLKGVLDQSISKRATVQDINVNPAFEKANVPVLQQQSNIQIYGAAYGELFKNLEIARFQYLNDMPILQVIDRPEYPLEVKKLSKLKGAIIFIFLFEVLLLLFIGVKYVLEE